jgi:hypothetical protein
MLLQTGTAYPFRTVLTSWVFLPVAHHLVFIPNALKAVRGSVPFG